MPVLLLALNQNQLPEGVLEEVKTLAQDYKVIITTDKAEIQTHLGDLEIAVWWFSARTAAGSSQAPLVPAVGGGCRLAAP